MEKIMPDYLLLMHNDPARAAPDSAWATYIERLASSGAFRGGSAIGGGLCKRKSGASPPVTEQIGGYIRLEAASLAEAETLIEGNPVYENGGTVELRELPKTS
jgi:hypothetical protein